MLARITAIAGTIIGWGAAATLIFLEQHPRLILAQAFFLAVGIVSSVWMLMACRNRPLGAAFELGYEMGRRDSIREANRSSKVVVSLPSRVERRQRAMSS